MKALIAIMVVVILGLVGITAAVIHFSSFDTLEANIITGKASGESVQQNAGVQRITKVETAQQPNNVETGTSAKDKLNELKTLEKIEDNSNADKTGYTIGYIMAQRDTSACQALIDEAEDQLSDAKQELKNSQEDLDNANQDLEDAREDTSKSAEEKALAEAQALEDRKQAQKDVEDALQAVSAAEESLMKKRLECASYK